MSDEKPKDRLFDMNGNVLREGDLVMILLDKPVLTGYITSIESSLLSKKPLGCLTVTGTVRLPYDPTMAQILRQTAKLVDPRSAELVDAITRAAKDGAIDLTRPMGVAAASVKLPETKKEPVEDKPTGPVLVSTDSKDVVDPRD